jgi:hypothetical protein
MTTAACTAPPPVPLEALLEYWLGELDEATERRFDEHLFACAACSARLRAIVDLGAAIRGELVRGSLTIVLPEPFLRRLEDAGLRVREYTLEPGGSVDCTVTPDDDLVVARLHAPLRDVRRLDLLIDDTTLGKVRATDVAFDPAAESLVAMTSTVWLRSLGRSQQRVRLVAVDGVHERVIADYTFNHYPSP